MAFHSFKENLNMVLFTQLQEYGVPSRRELLKKMMFLSPSVHL